ncbi:hypothetical protein CK203_107699 [Vitis vinifera]|uniref:DUF659 domain-containing protein n=1 Tax=Vitis vinifera TaxID=29760 RepID=A0A438CQW6_VITVI|nr:hypothetical protein CK203_107699 [Vitis vinifera]
MGDGWTDNRQRTLIKFLMYCPERISFMKSIDALDIVKDATNLFQLFGKFVERKEKDRQKFSDLVTTRFAAIFIALKSLRDHKHDLQALVTSKFFMDFRYSRDNKSRAVVSIILDNRFGNDCLIVVNLMSPLMHLLRIVDCDERP